MPGEAFNWMMRLKGIEREYKTVRLSMDRLKQQAKDDPHVLTEGLRFRDMDTVSDHLEGTYLVRLFSEFEAALRHFLRARKLRQPSRAEPLINKVRDRINISNAHAHSVHTVRNYRNTLVHDVDQPTTPVTMREATSNLSTFLSWLQRTW